MMTSVFQTLGLLVCALVRAEMLRSSAAFFRIVAEMLALLSEVMEHGADVLLVAHRLGMMSSVHWTLSPLYSAFV